MSGDARDLDVRQRGLLILCTARSRPGAASLPYLSKSSKHDLDLTKCLSRRLLWASSWVGSEQFGPTQTGSSLMSVKY